MNRSTELYRFVWQLRSHCTCWKGGWGQLADLAEVGRVDALDGELPGGEAVLEVGQRLLEEGDEAGLRRGVQLPLQPRREHLGLHPPVYQTLHTLEVLLVVWRRFVLEKTL